MHIEQLQLQYWVFVSEAYSANLGFESFKASFEVLSAAKAFAAQHEWSSIFNSKTGESIGVQD